MTNVIFGAAFGYRPEQLRPFLASAREHAPHARVVLLRERPDPVFLTGARAINPNVELYVPRYRWLIWFWDRVPARGVIGAMLAPLLARLWDRFRRARRVLEWVGSAMLHVECARFIWLGKFLARESGISRVLFCDTRDVVFQGDPFRLSADGLVTGDEPKRVRDCEYNTWWVCRLYDWGEYAAVRDSNILCAGVSVGDRSTMTAFAAAVTREFMTRLPHAIFQFGFGQSVHNVVLRRGKAVPFRVAGPGMVRIANLAYAEQTRIDTDDNVLDADGVPFDIVHQYDRHPALLAAVAARYPAPEAQPGR
jgi:hypothetical protein